MQAILRKISDLQKSLIYYNVNENVTVKYYNFNYYIYKISNP